MLEKNIISCLWYIALIIVRFDGILVCGGAG